MIIHIRNRTLTVLAVALVFVLLAGCGTAAAPSQPGAEPAAETQPETQAQTPVSDDGRPIVCVHTVDELLDAIAPDTVIVLESGNYNLPSAADYGAATDSPWYRWEEAYDGYQLTVQDVSNLSLTGEGMGETILSTDPRYADVVQFHNCKGIELSKLTVGHTQEPGYCAGGVLFFNSCEKILVEACGLYGCGTIGVWAMDSADLTVMNSSIYECSYAAVSVSRCRDVLVSFCEIFNHGTRSELGSAIDVFDAYGSDGFTVYRNRIHDNNAQYLLKLESTKNAAFLSNEVLDNRLELSFFAFLKYSAAVDGCSFSGNECPGGWYSGSEGRIQAYDAEGNTLDSASLEGMTYADIDPSSVVPAKGPSAPTEVAAGGEIVVSSVDDFLNAIGPDRTIILDGELFDLSSAANYGGLGGEYWYWQECYDGPELVIENVSGLSIRGSSTDPKDTVLSAVPRYANVLNFRNCENISVSGFTAGHTKEPGTCAGGVLNLDGCSQVLVEDMRLYGCGILGIQTAGCTGLSVLRTEIYECSYGAGRLFATSGIRFEGCDIHDVPSPAFSFTECFDLTWNDTAILESSGFYNVNDQGSLEVYVFDGDGYGEG